MNRFLGATLFLCAFGLYVCMGHPALSCFRDSGDLATASVTMGIAHPPGYPLYILSSRLFGSALPLGNPAYRLNVFSAFQGALTLLILGMILARVVDQRSMLGAVLLATCFGPALSQITLSEVYSLNALWGMGLLGGFFFLQDRPVPVQKRGWLLLAFLLGLGLGNHHSLIFCGFLFIVFLGRERHRMGWDSRLIVGLIGAGIAGFSIYSFIPIRASASPDYLWGDTHSLKGLWDILTRADYGTGTLSTRHSNASHGQGLLFWANVWAGQWGIAGTIALLWGSVLLLTARYRRSLGNPLWFLWALTGPLFAYLARLEPSALTKAILIPSLVWPGLLSAAAVAVLLHWSFSKHHTGFKGTFFRTTSVALWGIALATQGLPSLLAHTQRSNFLATDYARNAARTLPPQSVFLVITDQSMFSISYLQHALRQRPDIRLLVDADQSWRWAQSRKKYPSLFEPGQSDGGLDLIRVQGAKNRILTDGMQSKLVEVLVPDGIAARAVWPKRTDGHLASIIDRQTIWSFYNRRIPPHLTLADDYYSRELLRIASSSAFNAGLLLTHAGMKEEAQQPWAKALHWNPDRILRWSENF
ncbi:MAG TPA: DUF2723 domain-containing protein [Elusimicrobiota bacterium]|nr:DUF2723 domain-containing protein [Elusimicrobiota bacterium]